MALGVQVFGWSFGLAVWVVECSGLGELPRGLPK